MSPDHGHVGDPFWPVATSCALLVLLTAIGWCRRRYVVVDIVGISMYPAYDHGDRVLVLRTRCERVRRGQVVVFEHLDDRERSIPAAPPARIGSVSNRSWMLKRAVAVPGDPVAHAAPTKNDLVPRGHLVVLGDNPAASMDSRHFGYVRAERLLGVALRRMTGGRGGSRP